jgi:hypothetical protein
MAFLMIFAFTACEKDGVYNPKQKIKRTYVVVESTKSLSSEWTWNKNQLEKVDHYGGGGQVTWTERYVYEKNRIVKVEESSLESTYSYYQITYDGSHYKKIEYYLGTQLATLLEFEYSGKKISKVNVTMTYSGEFKIKENGFLSSIISKEVISSMAKLAKKQKGSKDNSITGSISYKYDGDNVKEIVSTYSYYDEDDDVIITRLFMSIKNNLLHIVFQEVVPKEQPLFYV